MKCRLEFARALLAWCALFWLLFQPVAGAAETSKTVSIHQVPPAVKKAIEEQAAGFKLGAIEREDSDGETTYTATITRNGQDRDFTVAEDGRALRLEIGLDEAPEVVRKTIQAQVGQGELDSLEQNFEEDDAYEAEFTKKDGTEGFISVTPAGKLACIQMSLEEVPAAVRKTIEANLGKGKLQALYRLIEKDETSYDAEVAFEDKTRDIMVAANGKLQSVQVFLSETPPPVQQTIQEKLGAGKLIRIDRSYEEQKGVMPYEIEARKDGKVFNFSVGPRGRFLGMDE